jgi:alpha-tubulin suppressor-like RCC1 family protein
MILLATAAIAAHGQRVLRTSSARQHHTGARTPAGRVVGWGSNFAGGLGVALNANTLFANPNINSWKLVGIAAGSEYSLHLTSSGSVIGFGIDSAGQLGDGPGAETTCNQVPCSDRVFVKGIGGTGILSNVVALAANGSHSLAVLANGRVAAWGGNSAGESGSSPGAALESPVQVDGAIGVMAVSAGEFHSLALKSDGTVLAWGDNSFGQLGTGATGGPNGTPALVKGVDGVGVLQNVVAIASGQNHNLALRSDGSVVAWGQNASGQIGINTLGGVQTTPVPVRVTRGFLDRATAISAGSFHSLALRSDGTVMAWGADTEGQLGNGASVSSQLVARPVVGLKGEPALVNVIAIACGNAHNVALLANGTAAAWGAGATGNGSSAVQPVPSLVHNGAGVQRGLTAVAAGNAHSLAILGEGPETNVVSKLGVFNPGPVIAGPAVAMSLGNGTRFVVQPDGSVLASGVNQNGQLGNGSTVSPLGFTPVVGVNGAGTLGNVVALSAGTQHTLALRADGTVVAWGSNASRQLGNPATGLFSTVPVTVTGPDGRGALDDVIAIAAGRTHSMALRSDGSVWTWGANEAGQLGNGIAVGVLTPTPAAVLNFAGNVPLTGVAAIAAGDLHSVALFANGLVATWGSDSAGQLGNGNGSPDSCAGVPCALRPVSVLSPITAVSISSRGNHVLALRHSGEIAAWGADQQGQLGNNTTLANQTAPQLVTDATGTGTLGSVRAIEAGFNHSVALVGHQIFSWGDNSLAQLGDGTSLNRPIPVQMVSANSSLLFFSPAEIAAGVGETYVLYAVENDL